MIRVSSIFSQMLQLFSRHEFGRAVVEHRAERHARGFTCWGQFVAMLFCHLGRAQSLREICGGLAASEGKLQHLGLPDAPKRSTLAYANQHRPWQLYQSVFYQLLDRCRAVAGGHGFRFRNKLLSLDATLIELCASVFDWAHYRRTKGAVKLHLLLDHQGLLPCFALVTEGRVHESRIARTLRFEPGTIVVFDRGFTDYDWFASLDADGVWFVTRMKDNADYGVVERRPVPERGPVQRDEIGPSIPLIRSRLFVGCQLKRFRNAVEFCAHGGSDLHGPFHLIHGSNQRPFRQLDRSTFAFPCLYCFFHKPNSLLSLNYQRPRVGLRLEHHARRN